MPLIEIKDLRKTHVEGAVPLEVLKGLSMNIDEGEFVAIMGPSGVGKSTLLRIMGLLEPQSSGSYRLNGREVTDYSRQELAALRNMAIGFVFQSFNLLARTNVYDNVKLPLLYSGRSDHEWDELIRKAIKTVGLEHRIDHEPAELSGGERQRVAIARALVNEPKVILADEPTGNLDAESGEMIMKTLQALNRDQKHTIILITHETYTAQHAERIITLKDGLVASDKHNIMKRDARKGFKK